MPLKRLRLTNLGPFDEIEFEFDEHVNVFTGPNNSGKSTVLTALGEIQVECLRHDRHGRGDRLPDSLQDFDTPPVGAIGWLEQRD